MPVHCSETHCDNLGTVNALRGNVIPVNSVLPHGMQLALGLLDPSIATVRAIIETDRRRHFLCSLSGIRE
jgi:hypothetical protein